MLVRDYLVFKMVLFLEIVPNMFICVKIEWSKIIIDIYGGEKVDSLEDVFDIIIIIGGVLFSAVTVVLLGFWLGMVYIGNSVFIALGLFIINYYNPGAMAHPVIIWAVISVITGLLLHKGRKYRRLGIAISVFTSSGNVLLLTMLAYELIQDNVFFQNAWISILLYSIIGVIIIVLELAKYYRDKQYNDLTNRFSKITSFVLNVFGVCACLFAVSYFSVITFLPSVLSLSEKEQNLMQLLFIIVGLIIGIGVAFLVEHLVLMKVSIGTQIKRKFQR